MKLKKKNLVALFKDFFYLTRSKFLVFVTLSCLILVYGTTQDEILGLLTWQVIVTLLIVIYLLLSVIWFSAK